MSGNVKRCPLFHICEIFHRLLSKRVNKPWRSWDGSAWSPDTETTAAGNFNAPQIVSLWQHTLVPSILVWNTVTDLLFIISNNAGCWHTIRCVETLQCLCWQRRVPITIQWKSYSWIKWYSTHMYVYSLKLRQLNIISK